MTTLFRCGTVFGLAWIMLLVSMIQVPDADARYFRNPDSDVDPSIFKINDKKHLGTRIDPKLELVNENGETIRFGDFQGKPTILVFSYYTCDGTCSAVNSVLKETLLNTSRPVMGSDYQVVTVSFDKDDTVDTLINFKEVLKLPKEYEKGWHLTLFKNPDQIQTITDLVGFKFHWSAQDQTFFHPNVYVFLSPEGRVVRYLYALTNDDTDMELAILDARQGQFRPNQVLDLAISLCYSYNFKEGRYGINIPLFVGVGSFLFGILLFIGSLVFFRKRRKKS